MAKKTKIRKSFGFQAFFGRKPRKIKKCRETIQGSIPIVSVHDKANLIESYDGCYTRTYDLANINYQTASETEQDHILTHYRAYLNSFGSSTEVQITIFNRNINLRQFEEEILIKETGDGFDHLRRESNKVLRSRVMEGKNGISKDTYVTIGVHTDSLKKAADTFKRLDRDIDKHMKMIRSSAKPVKIEDRLSMLHDIYNPDNVGELLTKTRVINAQGRMEEVTSFDFENIRSMGLSVKDVIAPSSFIIRPKHIEMGSQYVRALRVTGLPSILNDEFLSDLTNMPFNMLTTLNIRPIPNGEASALINRKLTLIREEKNNLQRANRANNIPEDMINPQVIEREEDTLALRNDMNRNDEHLFETTLTIVIFAPGMDQLQEYTDTIISECKKASVTCDVLTDQQEEGFTSTLPLCCNLLLNPRTLKSSSVAIFAPFSNLEINEPDGINYSMNAVSKNLLIYNRENKPNFNGFILGSSGCVDEKTEFYDGKEWKSIAKYKEGDKVLQFDVRSEQASLVSPSRYIRSKCDKMYHFYKPGVDMVLSEEHRVIYYSELGFPKVIRVRDLVKSIKNHCFHGYLYTGETFISLDDAIVDDYVPRNGEKYCFEVPTGALLLRRNGHLFVTGNSGKSFTAKTEILYVFLKKNADIMILDVEQEYVVLVHELGGQVIQIIPGGKHKINPLDITVNYEFDADSCVIDEIDGDTVDPVLEKGSFLTQMIGSMLGKVWGVDSIQKTLIYECLLELYAPFMVNGKFAYAPAPEETPTLSDMLDYFGRCKVPEAREIYYTLKRFAGDGALNVFDGHTNVELHNRLACFDISAVGEELKLMAMNIIQDAMWSRLVENRKIGKFTYIYCDEIHLYFQPGNESAAQFLCSLYKRARKYGGVPTGITQNPADILDHELGRKMLSEANFVQILNQQSDESREKIKSIFNLSDSSLDYITSAPPGQGLFFTGDNCVPFYSQYPKDNDIYPLLTSSMSDLVAYKEKLRREKIKADQEVRKTQYS
ncbi:MAG: hypothetical protein IJ245_04125 [Lachnospiraceae bacterium]|nr:hypothetical protein [Lachnospiraceae bacterium]